MRANMSVNWAIFTYYMYFRLFMRYNFYVTVGLTCCTLLKSNMLIQSSRAAHAAKRFLRYCRCHCLDVLGTDFMR